MATEKKNDKQVMDVSKPGKTPAEASSRPIILGHKPQIQDPMVNTAEDPNPTEPAPESEIVNPTHLTTSGSKRIIAPISESEVTAETTPTTEDKSETNVPDAPESDTEDQQTSESAEVDVVADQVGSRKLEEQQTEEEIKKQEALDKLIAEKKYFVPIGKAHRKRNARWIVFLLFFLVISVSGALLAADAGLVSLGFKPPTDFFKDKASEITSDTLQAKPTEIITETPVVETPKLTLSGEVLEYSDKNFGIKFSYPKEWGLAKTVPGPEDAHLIKGSELQITFESNDKVTLDVKTRDWEHDPDKGHGGVVYGGAYIGETPTSIIDDDSVVKMFFTKDNSFIAGMPFAGENCKGVGYLGIKALPANNKYEAIAIQSYETILFPDEKICEPEKYEAQLTTAGYDVIKKLFDSIQVL